LPLPAGYILKVNSQATVTAAREITFVCMAEGLLMASMGNAQRGALGGLAKLGEGARTTSDLSRVGGGLSRGANEGKKLNAAPWSDTFPAAGATLDLDFANNRGFVRGVGQGGVMDAITFTRASKGSYVGEDGLLKGMVPNLLGFTEDFDNAVWTKFNTTISANTQTAPNGTLTADKIIETATFGSHYIRQVVSVNASSEYTISFYIKAGERTKCEIWSHEGSPRFSASIDLVAETITANANVGTATYISSSINDEGDGWYRCSVTGTYGSAFNASISFLVFSDTGQQVYAGDGESGIFIWGAQLEVGSTATEYFPTNIGEPRFDWASTEQVAQRNLLTFSEQFDASVWTKLRSTATTNTTETTDPIGGNSAEKILATATTNTFVVFTPPTGTTGVIGETYTISVYAKAAEYTWFAMGSSVGSSLVWFDLANGNVGTVQSNVSNESIVSVGNGWYRCSLTIASWLSNGKVIFHLALSDNVVTFAGDATSGIYLWGAQFENGDTLTDYQAVSQSTNTTPLRANPTSNGILIEEARTNRLLWNRDATQTEWVKTNITATKDQTGIDGVANAASSLTATDDNGTCIQTITLAAGNRTGSVYLKRLTGTGNIQVTLDGSTYSTVELSDTEWYRIVLSGSVTNPTVGIKIAVDGDAVAMDYGQVEDGLLATSPILTTTATATRAVDIKS
jgi:hypothetical protein